MPDLKWRLGAVRLHAVVYVASAWLIVAAQFGIGAQLAPATRPSPVSSAKGSSTAAYLTVLIGRSMLSKASSCKIPAGMMTLDQVVPQLAQMGVRTTGAVIPDRTLATTTSCTGGTLYPSWADLTSLAATYGYSVVSASQSYVYMTTLTQTQQFQQSCGSLSAFIAHGFHRAWGLFAYPDNYWTTAIQTSVVQNCFAFGRTYVKAHKVTGAAATNTQSSMVAPWLQRTVDVGGGRCNLSNQPCSTEGGSSLGSYLSPLTLHAFTQVAAGTWTAIQGYAFATGANSSGTVKWDCTAPETNWQAHWTSQFETYCWNDFVYGLTGIPASVTVTDPATVADAWGRAPTPLVVISSVNPSTLTSTSTSTAVTWYAEENGTYSVLVGGTDCSSGTQVASGTYSTSPSPITTTVSASAFSAGSNALRVCLTNDPGHRGSASSTVTLVPGPTVSSVSPSVASLSGGIQVTVTGTNFASGATVAVGGVPATSVTVVSPTQITAVLPAAPGGKAGTYDLVVTESAGTSPITAGDQVIYEAAPSVTGVSPAQGPLAGGTQITITGTNFYPDATVAVGGTAATSVHVVSSTQITAVVPAAPNGGTTAGPQDVVVAEVGGTSPIGSADQFTYEAAPSVSGVNPSTGPATGGTQITISGSDFYPDATVTVGGVSATIVSISPTSIVATTPPGALGPQDVVVTDAGGSSPTGLQDQFTYI